MKRSRTLWVLVVFFAWATLKSAGAIYWAESATDYALLSSLGLGVVFYGTSVPLLLGEAATAFLLFKQKARAYVVGFVVVVAESVNGVLTSAIAALHSDTAKALYVASREARGMTVRQESELGFMFSPMGIGLMALAYVAFWALVFYYIRRVKAELVR